MAAPSKHVLNASGATNGCEPSLELSSADDEIERQVDRLCICSSAKRLPNHSKLACIDQHALAHPAWFRPFHDAAPQLRCLSGRWYRRLSQMATRLTARVVRVGEQLAVLLPSRAIGAIGVQAGDVVEVTASDDAVVIRSARRSLTLPELVRRITPENRHDEICWSPNTGREAW